MAMDTTEVLRRSTSKATVGVGDALWVLWRIWMGGNLGFLMSFDLLIPSSIAQVVSST
jgi:hypothetical protein